MSRRSLNDLAAQIAAVADALDGHIGAALTFLPTGESLFVCADDVFPTASVIKIAIVSELFAQAGEGRLSPDTPVTVRDEDLVPGSGVLALLRPGLILPLSDLAMLAIAVSDNTASNLCLRAAGGPEAVNARMRDAWGMTSTTIIARSGFIWDRTIRPTRPPAPRAICFACSRCSTRARWQP
jgi:beta-lactamase class A